MTASPCNTVRTILADGTAVAPAARRKRSGPAKYRKGKGPIKVPMPGGSTLIGRGALTDAVKTALSGDPDRRLDSAIPLHALALKIARELTEDEQPVWQMHRLLELIWDRLEGKVPDKLETDIRVQGVIALPVVQSSALDWSRDAIEVLAPVQNRPALPSPNQDE